MVTKAKQMSISFPESFLPILEESIKLVEKDPRFQDTLLEVNPRYSKKNPGNKFQSIVIRFFVGYYLMNRKRELQIEDNKRNVSEKERIDIGTKEKSDENVK